MRFRGAPLLAGKLLLRGGYGAADGAGGNRGTGNGVQIFPDHERFTAFIAAQKRIVFCFRTDAGRLGRNGCVWALGDHRNPMGATTKKEGDGRSPAGIFSLGGLWVNNPTPVQHDPANPYVQVGPNDLWVSDPRLPHLYNRHLRLDHPATTPWEKHEQMRQSDYPHSIKLLVHHNTPESVGKPIVGAGSSIFFHIWRRDGEAPTAGCTSMDEQTLRQFIARLRADKKPVYILLPRSEYTRRRKEWNLP